MVENEETVSLQRRRKEHCFDFSNILQLSYFLAISRLNTGILGIGTTNSGLHRYLLYTADINPAQGSS